MTTLDAIDVVLLNLLQDDSAATAEALARRVPLSPSAITRRIRRLREEGLIAAQVAILSPALTARRLKALVHIQLRDHAETRSLRAFHQRLDASTDVQLLLEVSGAFDLVALVVVHDMAAFNAFADRMLAHDRVRRYETSFVKKELKHRPRIALDERDAG